MALIHFLKPKNQLEADGITSPVVSVSCQYKQTTTFDDAVQIEVVLEKYSGVKLEMSYTMTNLETGAVVFTGQSSHCFIDENGRPVAVKKHFPDFDAALKEQISQKNCL